MCVPHVVRDVVRNVCQLALTLHLARHSADHDPLTNIANRRSLRRRPAQRLGPERPLRLGLHLGADRPRRVQGGQRPARPRGGRRHAALLRLGPAPLRAQRRHHGPHGRRRVRHHSGQRGRVPRSWPSPSGSGPCWSPCPSSTSRSAPPPRRPTRPTPPSSTALPTPASTRRRASCSDESTIEEDFELELRSLPGVVNVGIEHSEERRRRIGRAHHPQPRSRGRPGERDAGGQPVLPRRRGHLGGDAGGAGRLGAARHCGPDRAGGGRVQRARRHQRGAPRLRGSDRRRARRAADPSSAAPRPPWPPCGTSATSSPSTSWG